MRENTFRLGISQTKPYQYYYGAISPIKGLEIDGKITEVLGTKITNPKFRGYGNFKDKAIDFKYQILPEGKYMPALALGIMDPHGTRIYASQYIAASKQIYPFDFTFGMGNGRFGKRQLPEAGEGIKLEILTNPKEWLSDSQFFWGMQFAPSEKYALMFEYSPIKYHGQTRDPAQAKYFQKPVPSHYNFGLWYKPTKWFEINVSYQRGNQVSAHLSMEFEIGKPIIPIIDISYKEKPEDKLNPLSQRLTTALYYSGFSDITVFVEDGDLLIYAQNERYYYPAKAIGVILDILSETMPEDIRNVSVILYENGIPLIELTSTRADIIDLNSGRLTVNEFLHLSEINTRTPNASYSHGSFKKTLRYGLKPDLQTFLNDPSGFFKYRFGIIGWTSYSLWKGASLITGIATYPVNNISSANEPLSIPVRTDLVFYKKKKVSLDRLMFEQIERVTHGAFAKFSAGLLEVQYAGIDAEVAAPVLDGRMLLGLSGSMVKKRDADNPFKLVKNDVKDIYTTAFFNTRFNIPETEMAIDVKAGRFLAGDNGVRFTISKFINGVTLWAWYTITDTSVFKDNINKGYHDKGIGISIPLRLFKGSDSRTAYSYILSPWTRDTGQDIEHYTTLFNLIGRNTKIFKKDFY